MLEISQTENPVLIFDPCVSKIRVNDWKFMSREIGVMSVSKNSNVDSHLKVMESIVFNFICF